MLSYLIPIFFKTDKIVIDLQTKYFIFKFKENSIFSILHDLLRYLHYNKRYIAFYNKSIAS